MPLYIVAWHEINCNDDEATRLLWMSCRSLDTYIQHLSPLFGVASQQSRVAMIKTRVVDADVNALQIVLDDLEQTRDVLLAWHITLYRYKTPGTLQSLPHLLFTQQYKLSIWYHNTTSFCFTPSPSSLALSQCIFFSRLCIILSIYLTHKINPSLSYTAVVLNGSLTNFGVNILNKTGQWSQHILITVSHLQFLQIPRTTDDLHSVSNQRPAHCSTNAHWRSRHQRYTSYPTLHA